MFDLVLRGGQVVTPSGLGNWDVAVRGGRIAALGEPASLDESGDTTIDVTGKLVVPGGIDPHVHCDWPHFNPLTNATLYTAGPDVVSRAALHGGTTTLVDFVVPAARESLEDATDRLIRRWDGTSYCDFSYHIMLQDRPSRDALDAIPRLIERGFPSFKVFLTNVRPSISGRKIDFGSLWEVMHLTAAHNGILAVHGEDDELVMHMYEKLIAAGDVGFENMSVVHSALSEDMSFRRVMRLAEHVPGTALYMMHVSAALGVEAIRDAKRRGLAVYGETLHQYALKSDEDYLEPDGMKYHTYPSLKSKADNAALWDGVVTSDIVTFGTDELCTTYAEKTAGRRIDNVTGGNTGAEPRMVILYTEVVTKRDLGVEKFVALTSTNAAKILGLYPRKGAVAVGSDADLAVFDPSISRQLSAGVLHESDYTPWEGWEVTAWPVMTVLRGEVVVRDGQFLPTAAGGALAPRRLSADVCRGRALE